MQVVKGLYSPGKWTIPKSWCDLNQAVSSRCTRFGAAQEWHKHKRPASCPSRTRRPYTCFYLRGGLGVAWLGSTLPSISFWNVAAQAPSLGPAAITSLPCTDPPSGMDHFTAERIPRKYWQQCLPPPLSAPHNKGALLYCIALACTMRSCCFASTVSLTAANSLRTLIALIVVLAHCHLA